MFKAILSLAVALVSVNALAYSPSSKVLQAQDFACDLRSQDGEVLHAKLSRKLWDIVRTPGTRMLISGLALSDGTGVETGDGNLDKLLKPHFGAARFDQSSVSVVLENVTGKQDLVMTPLASQTIHSSTAWGQQHPDDMQLDTRINVNGQQINAQVTFAAYGRQLRLAGACIQTN